MIPESLLKDIKKTLREKHDCGTQDQIDKAMLRPNDFKDDEGWLIVKLGYRNPGPRELVKRRLNRMDAADLKVEHVHICGAEVLRDMTNVARKDTILETLEKMVLSVEKRSPPGWDKQARTNINQDSNSAVCKTTLACTNLGFSSAMLTIVMDVNTVTQSVLISSLNIVNWTSARQGTWRCDLPARFVDREQITVQELMALRRMPHTIHDGHHRN